MTFLRIPSPWSLVALSIAACLSAGCGGDDGNDDDAVKPVAKPTEVYLEPPPVPRCGRQGAPPPASEPFERLRYAVAAHWVGTATPTYFPPTPWPVEITFDADGRYQAARYGDTPSRGPFSYGRAPGNTMAGAYELVDLKDNGDAWGDIMVPFDGKPLRGEISRLEVDESLGHMYFEFRPSWLDGGSEPYVAFELSCLPDPGPSVTPPTP